MKVPAMRHLAIPPTLFAIVGFALTMVCIFAGSQPGYMEDTDLITLNTSMIGFQGSSTPTSNSPSTSSASPSSSTSSSSSSSGLFSDLKGSFSSVSSEIGDDIQNDINSGIRELAKQMNISGFYSWHLLTACKGFYEPGPVVNASNPSPWKNVTSCSPRAGFYAFNTSALLLSSVPNGTHLGSIVGLSGMNNAIETVIGAAHAMFVLYCMAAASAGLAMLTGLAAVLKDGMMGGMFNAGLNAFAFIILGLASTVATLAINKVQSAVQEVASEIGIEAVQGSKFINISWVGTLMLALAAIGWTVDFILAKRQLARAAQALEKAEAA